MAPKFPWKKIPHEVVLTFRKIGNVKPESAILRIYKARIAP